MAERYFLILVVAITFAGSLWLSFVDPVVSYGIFLSSLLGLLGLVSIAYASSPGKASMLMPLFFITAIAYEAYLYVNGRFGYILISLFLLSLIGLILGFGISPKKPAKAAKPAVHAASAPASRAMKKPAKKASRKKRR